MKKIFYVIATFLFLSCGDGVDLPSPGVETDLYKLPIREEDKEALMKVELKPESEPMIHCGALHTPEDFEYIKARLSRDPWKTGYASLVDNYHSHLDYVANPQADIRRGVSGDENYMRAANDVAAAYQMGLRYHLGDGNAYADHAIEILDSWAVTCKLVTGNTNSALAAGLYGYEFAVAGELLRDYWKEKDANGFARYQQWMLDVFYVANHEFLVNHFGTVPGHYWANWGLCNLASMIGIGILADRRDVYKEGIEHLQIGETNGRLTHAINHVFTGDYANLAQWQESGRDIGHTMLCQGLMGVICQLTWNQGDDFFGYDDNRYLKGCEYNGRYLSAGMDVPFEAYYRTWNNAWGPTTDKILTIAERNGSNGAGAIWALAYYHYAKIKGVDTEKCQYTKMGMEISFPEIAGLGGTSGGYDHLGYGNLMYARD